MKYHLGVDLGATNIAVGLVDEKYNIIGRGTLPANPPRTAEQICDDIVMACHLAAGEAFVSFENILSVGIGAPGMCNHKSGELIFANNLGLYHVQLKKMLEERLHIPCYIENDANAAAFGEYLAGGAKGYNSVLMVTLGTGVGGGLMLGGKIFTGAHFAGAEIGHMPMVFDGRPCNCGKRGCIETYCSATGLVKTIKEAMLKDRSSVLWSLCGHNIDAINAKTVFNAKKKGDKTAEEIIDLYLRQLADALSGYINFIEPEILLLGGGISKQGNDLIIPLRKLVGELVYDRFAEKQTKIESAVLGNDAGIIGAAFLSEAGYID